jgi:glycosyltransferase involved in cell wall biosynthesis
VLNIGRLLSRSGKVSFVIVPTELEDAETVCRTRQEFDVLGVMRPASAAQPKSLNHLSDRLRHEFDAAHMATDPYELSKQDRGAMLDLIERHDLVWIHTIRTANWFRIYRWPHSVLDVDDLPSRASWSKAWAGGSALRRLLDFRMAGVWRRRERRFPDRFDVLTVCSEEDRQYLGTPERIYVLPNGSRPQPNHSRASSGLPRIGLIGNCTYAPNEEGLKWFILEVWPKVKREFAAAQLRLVGRGSDGCFKDLGSDIIGLGWLEDPGKEIASWSAMIVPIKMGSGTRVKLVDGFARGCPVVATTMGAFGYDVTDGEEILLADRPDDFASACTHLLRDPGLGMAIAEKARKRFLERWTWESFENTVGKVVQECLARSSHGPLAHPRK